MGSDLIPRRVLGASILRLHRFRSGPVNKLREFFPRHLDGLPEILRIFVCYAVALCRGYLGYLGEQFYQCGTGLSTKIWQCCQNSRCSDSHLPAFASVTRWPEAAEKIAGLRMLVAVDYVQLLLPNHRNGLADCGLSTPRLTDKKNRLSVQDRSGCHSVKIAHRGPPHDGCQC